MLMVSNKFALVCVRHKRKEEEVRQQTEDSFSYLLSAQEHCMVILGKFFYFLIWWVVLEFEIRTSCFLLGALLLELYPKPTIVC
jgi:hypothetical protein